MEQAAPERPRTYEERIEELTRVVFRDEVVTVIDETKQSPSPSSSEETEA